MKVVVLVKGNLLQYIDNSYAGKQYEYFATPVSYGLTVVGQARINQSIEAFCLLCFRLASECKIKYTWYIWLRRKSPVM